MSDPARQAEEWRIRFQDAEESRRIAQREAINVQLDLMEAKREIEELKIRLAEMKMRKKTGKP